jgi:hypothetical protein
MTSTQLPSDVFPQAPTVQIKIDRQTDNGNFGRGWREKEGRERESMFVKWNRNKLFREV